MKFSGPLNFSSFLSHSYFLSFMCVHIHIESHIHKSWACVMYGSRVNFIFVFVLTSTDVKEPRFNTAALQSDRYWTCSQVTSTHLWSSKAYLSKIHLNSILTSPTLSSKWTFSKRFFFSAPEINMWIMHILVLADIQSKNIALSTKTGRHAIFCRASQPIAWLSGCPRSRVLLYQMWHLKLSQLWNCRFCPLLCRAVRTCTVTVMGWYRTRRPIHCYHLCSIVHL